MKKTWLVLLALTLAAAIAVASPDAPAQDPASPEPAAAATPEPPATETQETPSEETEPLETFVPSEKLPADSAIAFPVDI